LSPAVGTGTFSPTTATVVNGVATFNISFEQAGPQTVNASFSGSTAITGTATQLAISPPSPVLTTPVSQVFTVTAEDQFGNQVTTYNQTADLSSTGAAATIPDSVDLTDGQGSFTGSFNASGTVQVTATGPDPINPANSLTGTATVVLNPGG